MSRLCLTLLLLPFPYVYGFGCDEIIREGESCALSRGLFKNQFLPMGYNKITTIPASACNITFLQMRPTLNSFAVRKTDGNYVFNGVRYKEGSVHSIQTDGGTFTYIRNEDGERLSIPGPIKQPMELMLYTRQENMGISYEYYHSTNVDPRRNEKVPYLPPAGSPHQQDLPLESYPHLRHHHQYALTSNIKYSHGRPQEDIEKTAKKTSKYDWFKSGYSECTKSCAGGIQEIIFVCKRIDRDMIVPDKRCSGVEQPPKITRPCNSRPCLAAWTTSNWGSCSVTCGDGIQTREIRCMQQINPHTNVVVSPAACGYTERPVTSQSCSPKPCESVGIWISGPWQECSSQCGPGMRTRSVTCSSSNCPTRERPAESIPCEGDHCYNNRSSVWVTSEWSNECSGFCGEGIEERRVVCHGGDDCDKYVEPVKSRKCETRQEVCSGQWFTGPWGKCTGKCEMGERKRGVVCISTTEATSIVVAETNCNAADKPVNREYCELPPCPVEWFTSEWGECISGCDGVQERRVVCLDGKNEESAKCYKEPQPPSSQSCEMESCNQLQPSNITIASHNRYKCSDKLKNCRIAAQARMCAYEFYMLNCCYSCSRKKRYPLK